MSELSREEAWALVTEYIQSESLRRHCLSVETAMRAYAAAKGDAESRTDDFDNMTDSGGIHNFLLFSVPVGQGTGQIDTGENSEHESLQQAGEERHNIHRQRHQQREKRDREHENDHVFTHDVAEKA